MSSINTETETVIKKILPYMKRRGYDIEKDLNKIRSKVLIIGINQDQYFPPNLDAIPMHNLIEDSELIIYDSDLGHIGFRELETIEEELSEFMKNFRWWYGC